MPEGDNPSELKQELTDKSAASPEASSNRFGRLRELVKQQQTSAQGRFEKDAKRKEPSSSFAWNRN